MKANAGHNISAIVIMISALLTMQSCITDGQGVIRGDGNVRSITYQLDSFRMINISGMYDVRLEAGDKGEVVLETDENIHEITDINVEDSTLYIRNLKEGAIRPTRMEMIITYPMLESIVIGGACRLHAPEHITAGSFSIEVSGAADIDLKFEVTELSTVVSGAAKIVYEGAARRHSADMSGASSLRAENLRTQETSIEISGAGSAHVFALEKLNAVLSGVGSIRYYGEPAEVITDRSGLGRIKKAG